MRDLFVKVSLHHFDFYSLATGGVLVDRDLYILYTDILGATGWFP